MSWEGLLQFFVLFGGIILIAAATILGSMWAAKRLGLFSDD